MSARIWIETKDGEKKQILAPNLQIWKHRGAKRCKPPKSERAVKAPSGERRSEYPKHVGGGWWDRGDGGPNVRKDELTAEELERIE